MSYSLSYRLHDLTLLTASNSTIVGDIWQGLFAALEPVGTPPDVRLRLDLVDEVPGPPGDLSPIRDEKFLSYYRVGKRILAHFPEYGEVLIDFEARESVGRIVEKATTMYGVLEDLIAIALSPHLRRQGLFLVHAFAAAKNSQGVMLVGGIGAGKTTTGMSLLSGGYKLVSNDSPLINPLGEVLLYPGPLAAHPDDFRRFSVLAKYADQKQTLDGRNKVLVDPVQPFGDVWEERVPLRAIVFPKVSPEKEATEINLVEKPEALRRLIPHTIEHWDAPMIPSHLSAISSLVESVSAYDLLLSPNVDQIPGALDSVL